MANICMHDNDARGRHRLQCSRARCLSMVERWETHILITRSGNVCTKLTSGTFDSSNSSSSTSIVHLADYTPRVASSHGYEVCFLYHCSGRVFSTEWTCRMWTSSASRELCDRWYPYLSLRSQRRISSHLGLHLLHWLCVQIRWSREVVASNRSKLDLISSISPFVESGDWRISAP